MRICAQAEHSTVGILPRCVEEHFEDGLTCIFGVVTCIRCIRSLVRDIICGMDMLINPPQQCFKSAHRHIIEEGCCQGVVLTKEYAKRQFCYAIPLCFLKRIKPRRQVTKSAVGVYKQQKGEIA